MPLDIDGEGLPHRSPSPLPPSPGKGDIMVEGAVHLRGAIKNDTVVFSAGRPEAVPYILNYQFCFSSAERLADLSLSMLLPKTKKR